MAFPPLLKEFIYIFSASIIAKLTALLATINYTTDLATRPNPFSDTPITYDFIIGGGSTGGIIANRISADPKFKVLVLEAGGDPLLTENIPYLSGYILNKPMTDWMYKVVPQNNSCFSYENNAMNWPRGKSLGGCSNVNHLLYMRGNPKDFDNWANLTNDQQWNYENCLPYFKKSEKYNGNFPNFKYHGTEGPLIISAPTFQPMIEEWLKAGKEMGLPNVDPNGHQTSGMFPVDATLSDGKRWGVYDAFIKPALHRTNLHVIRYAHVVKVILDETNKATGVTYVRHGKTITALASKEIILSAGAIGSPHILMLSGIGSAVHLKSVGIEPKVNLPGVGQNLQDHVSSPVGPFFLNESVSFISDRNFTSEDLLLYFAAGTGPMSFNHVSGLGHISTSNVDPAWPNIALTYIPFGIQRSFPKDISAMFGIPESIMQEYLGDFIGKDANIVLIYSALPASRGSITLKSSNPFDHPLINPNYYSDPMDMKVMIEAFKFVIKMFEEANTWQRFNATFTPKHFPGCEKHVLKSDEYYECYLRHFTGTMWHPACTCKMGSADDPLAVLDSNLRVRKVSGLRIADSSVMPQITNANTNAPCMMIGEKAADLILNTWSV